MASRKLKFAKFRDADFEALVPPVYERQVEFSDALYAGLKLRVSKSYGDHRRVWCWQYKDAEGKARRINYGIWPGMGYAEAVEAHKAARATYDAGRDPIAAQEARQVALDARTTVAELADLYERVVAPEKSTGKEIVRLQRKHVVPFIGVRAVADVTDDDIIAMLRVERERLAANEAARLAKNPDAAPRSGISVTRLFKAASALFNLAVRERLIKATPVPKLRAGFDLPEPKAKRRPLSDEELKSFWLGLDKTRMSASTKAALRLILLTGCRPKEILELRRRHVDLAGTFIDRRSGEPVERAGGLLKINDRKSGDDFVVPVSPLARAILIEALAAAGAEKDALLFPGREGKVMKTNKLDQAFARAREKLGFSRHDNAAPHCLRSTAADIAVRLGFGIDGAENILGHRKGSVAARHYVAYDGINVRHDILRAVARHVERTVGMEKATEAA